MGERAISGAPPSWTSAGRAGLVERLAMLVLAAAGHVVFLSSLFEWEHEMGWSFSLALAAVNVLSLATLTLGQRRRPLTVARAIGATVLVSAVTFTFVLLALGQLDGSRSRVVNDLVTAAVYGSICGLLGATVTVPLSLAVDRWRADPSVRRRLDAWATLACIGSVFAWMGPRTEVVQRACPTLARCSSLPALHLALLTTTLALATGLWAWEERARRSLADAAVGKLAGHEAVDPQTVDVAGLPKVSLTDLPLRFVALVRGSGSEAYRENASPTPRALVPVDEPISWRGYVLPLVAAVCAVGLALRLG